MSYVFPVLGFDVGGTKIAVCLANSDGEILGSRRIQSRGRGPDDALSEMVEVGSELLRDAGIRREHLRAVGVGAPAPMDIPNGLLLAPTNMKNWIDVPIRDHFAEAFQVETFFDNDANAGALAEWFFGAGRGCLDLIYLTMSTGIGGGLVVNGHLVHGKGFLAGEMGHVTLDVNGPECPCGMRGCYEAFCGGVAVAKRLREAFADRLDHSIVKAAGGAVEDLDMIALAKAVKEGDPDAKTFWDGLAARHAQAIGGFINIFNPELIVLGTMAWANGALFMDPLMERLPDYCWKETLANCRVVPSELKKNIGEYSGVCVALNELYERGQWEPSRKI